MTHPARPSPVRRRTARTALAALTALALLLTGALAGPAAADGDRDDRPGRGRAVELTVMSQNLYLGSSLLPAVQATTQEEFLGAVAGIWTSVQTTDFPTRSEALAEEIAEEEPDLIGLQEVAEWTLVDRTTAPPTASELDFLDVLLADLAAEGLSYSVAAVSDNADIGPVPLVQPCAGPVGSCLLTFRDRDVVLVNDHTPGLRVRRADHGRFAAQVALPTPVGPLSFDRGWALVDVKYRGAKARFLNTHLETDDFPAVQLAQGLELLAGPLARRGRAIAVGDFNSAADGSTTATYRVLTALLRDAWTAAGDGPGLTCCQTPLLANPVSTHRTRIDLVLTRRASATDADLIAEEAFRPAPPRWISDHAGVIADIRLR